MGEFEKYKRLEKIWFGVAGLSILVLLITVIFFSMDQDLSSNALVAVFTSSILWAGAMSIAYNCRILQKLSK